MTVNCSPNLKKCSHHFANTSKDLGFTIEKCFEDNCHKLFLNSPSWEAINADKAGNSLNPVCYSNVIPRLDHWCDWFGTKSNLTSRKKSKHRKTLQPWNLKFSSYLLKKILKHKKNKQKLGVSGKLKLRNGKAAAFYALYFSCFLSVTFQKNWNFVIVFAMQVNSLS